MVDLLRERLQSVGAELIDSKARVTELEGTHIADREALRISTITVTESNKDIKCLAHTLKDQQVALNEALLVSAELETKLTAAIAE